MFLNIQKSDALAAIDEQGQSISYSQLCDCAVQISNAVPPRSLVFSFCENSIGSLVGYVSFLSCNVVPLMLDRGLDEQLAKTLIETYHPTYLWIPKDMLKPSDMSIISLYNYHLIKTEYESYLLYKDLALLITTSGSTGSPKLVRQSYTNLEENAKSIASYLKIDNTERPITTLPMNYVYGISIINSHLLMGATILLTTKGLMQKEFWEFFKQNEATSIAGVPYTYEILKKLRFFTMKLPSLRTMTQAGGKLLPELHRQFAEYAHNNNQNFVVMYGAAEATARMGYLPAERSLEKYGSMGVAIPGGEFLLIDENGTQINEINTVGELVYYGKNVTLGYAESNHDLSKGDERGGRLETGDMAKRDSEGIYTIVGRKKRFLKLFGNRVGLDETERLVKSNFEGIECACSGIDDLLYTFVTSEELCKPIKDFLAASTGINPLAFIVKSIDEIPKNDAGKTLYAKLEQYFK